MVCMHLFSGQAQAQGQTPERFTSAAFLTWKLSEQRYYFRTSIGMASLIAKQNDEDHARCLEEWYFEREQDAADYILDLMQDNQEYHPRAIIVGVLQKVCGPFRYAAR